MTIEVVPFEAGCGAEIRGVDIRQKLSPAERDAIRAAWLQHLVLRFREQPMSDSEHMAFTRQFGELEFNPGALIAKQYGVEDYSTGRRAEIPPEISVISNIIENGKAIGGLGDGEAFWHTDSSFVDVPPAASLLRSNKPAEALAGYRAVITEHTDSIWVAEAHYHVGLCLQQLRRTRQAKASFRYVTVNYPGNRWAGFAEDRLKEIRAAAKARPRG